MRDEKKEIAVLGQISAAVIHQRNPDRLMEGVLDILSREMGMLRATFTLRHGDVFEIEASRGLDPEQKSKGRYLPGEGITGAVAAEGRPCLVPDISTDAHFLNRTGSHKAGERLAFLCVPVQWNNQIVGTLSIERATAPVSDLKLDLKLLEIVGNLTAEALAVLKREYEERQSLREENRRLRDAVEQERPGKLIGNCRNMREVYRLIRQAAPTDATILIRGASGTGKELVAQAIRQLSSRAKGPFVTLNCAAIPEPLLESEMFGHEKGAFTGAAQKRLGRVEAADGGTLFLDEIGDLSLSGQVKLLRFLQERTFSRVGSSDEIKADVRIIAATSRDLEKLISEEKFREDLYYRLNVFPILIPDLAHRRCDIVLLAEHFIAKYNLRYARNIRGLSNEAVNALVAYPWPGNVRELENCIERAVLTAPDDSIRSTDLPPSLQAVSETLPRGQIEQGDFKSTVDAFARNLIVEALRRSGGNHSVAGRELKLSARMMNYNIHRYGIDPREYEE